MDVFFQLDDFRRIVLCKLISALFGYIICIETQLQCFLDAIVICFSETPPTLACSQGLESLESHAQEHIRSTKNQIYQVRLHIAHLDYSCWGLAITWHSGCWGFQTQAVVTNANTRITYRSNSLK